MSYEGIFRKTTCDICGLVEWKPAKITEYFANDQVYDKTTDIEPSDFKELIIVGTPPKRILCPDCTKEIIEYMDSMRNRRTVVKKHEKEPSQ